MLNLSLKATIAFWYPWEQVNYKGEMIAGGKEDWRKSCICNCMECVLVLSVPHTQMPGYSLKASNKNGAQLVFTPVKEIVHPSNEKHGSHVKFLDCLFISYSDDIT